MSQSVQIVPLDGAVRFTVYVVSRANRDEVVGKWLKGFKIRLSAPPVDDRANTALRRLLADRLNVPLAAVRIISGEHSRTKRVEAHGVTEAAVLALTG